MLIRFTDGKVKFLDYREKAPAAASRDMYLDEKGEVIKDASLAGYKAVAVPGSVAGLAYAQKKWGRLPLTRVMAPAIKLAREGFVLTYEDAQDLADSHLSKFPESKRVFQRNGNLYQQGEVLKQPELARTLERIANNPKDFYSGSLAKELAAAIQRGGGLITEKDLRDYEVKEREPIHGTYRGYEVFSAPPPSSGGVALIEALNILEGWDMHKLGARSAESVHLTAEAFRRAMMDRADFLGDPDFNKIPVAQLTDKKYASAWRETIDPEKATVSKDMKRPEFGDLDRMAAAHAPALGYESSNTTHYSVVDQAGNAVSVTTTLNDTLGSKVMAEGLGFLLNDEMDDFAAKQGVPNAYGLIQGPANSIEGGKRPLSAMTPTIVVKDGKLAYVLGSPGGPKIITTVANILMGVVDYGLDIQQAVAAPRFHHQWLPDSIAMEKVGFSPDTEKALSNLGHKLDFRDYWSDGECIAIDPKTGERLGAPDPRNNGAAAGF